MFHITGSLVVEEAYSFLLIVAVLFFDFNTGESSIINPSLNNTRLSLYEATSGSCVTITIDIPNSLLRLVNRFIISSVFFESRFDFAGLFPPIAVDTW